KGSTARAIRSRSSRRTAISISRVRRPASGVRLRFFHVEINRETANHAVFQPGCSERRFHPSCQVKELFHAFLEERIDVKRHSVPLRIIASAAVVESLLVEIMPVPIGEQSAELVRLTVFLRATRPWSFAQSNYREVVRRPPANLEIPQWSFCVRILDANLPEVLFL